MRILLAEDERSLSRAVTALLERSHYAVDAVYDGHEALDYLESGNYDALILDIMMPKVDGLKVLKVIRGLERQHNIPVDQHLKVIMMTAIADVEYVDQAFQLGCDAYASKPIDTEKVQEVMQNLNLIE